MDYFLPCDGFFILNQSRAASFKHKHGEPSLGSMPITTVGTVWKFSVSRDLQGLNCQILLIGPGWLVRLSPARIFVLLSSSLLMPSGEIYLRLKPYLVVKIASDVLTVYVEYHWYITGWVLRGYDLSWQHAGWLRGPQLSQCALKQ